MKLYALFKKTWAMSLLIFVLLVSLTPVSQAAAFLSVAQALENQNNSVQTVKGYVVGQPTGTSTVITSNYPNDYALALADSSNETNTDKMVYVQIPSNLRSTFGLQSHSELKGKSLTVTGTLTPYFSHSGIKSVTSISTETGGTDPAPDPTEPTVPVEDYYRTAAEKTGNSLKTELHNIIDHHTELSYSAVWEALKKTDEDPANANNVILLYTGRSQAKGTNGGGVDDWNREHVWAKSHGDFGTAMGPGTDLHHLRPADVSVNSTRGNLDFDNGGTEHSEALGNYFDSDSWEPRDEVKGDVARMLFYMAVRYEGDVSDEPDLELNNTVNNGTAPYHGKLSVLLQWNAQDPVDDRERRRNDIIYSDYQHNRNPFIDHPEWVNEIWN
ncbi:MULTISPECIES: endonuclease [Priestia]|uniref:Extracellular ribonuclease n=2 Tax=Priestia TaxID=2800373 RepID=D5DXM3_PRIM1|nr:MULTISPECIES: endonuclease [Priestia]MCJ7983822.1 endonuclease [Priestia sp. OVL9]ADE67437.1 Extracellular ribonuclease [Priestia megaterium QM B1551]KAA8754134.1 ribonuclease [Priestia megaterium]MBA9041654.1 endonuclease I [Priestia aryabhattai]MBG9930544.1 ribonuclease [Priestia aryabhattai]